MAPLIIVEKHHNVLPHWAECRRKMTAAPRLITLDHHTDTSPPFRNYLKNVFANQMESHEALRGEWLQMIDFRNSLSVENALQYLSNDEHIVTALGTDIVSSAFVIAHNATDTDLKTYRTHKIMCRSVNAHSKSISREECDGVLESSFLDRCLYSMCNMLKEAGETSLPFRSELENESTASDFILDIDLDYFNTHLSFQPSDPRTFRRLVKNASLVTIATEPDYVRSCAYDQDLTSEGVLLGLQNLMGCLDRNSKKDQNSNDTACCYKVVPRK